MEATSITDIAFRSPRKKWRQDRSTTTTALPNLSARRCQVSVSFARMRQERSFTLTPLLDEATKWWIPPTCIWTWHPKDATKPALTSICATGCGIMTDIAWRAWWTREDALPLPIRRNHRASVRTNKRDSLTRQHKCRHPLPLREAVNNSTEEVG